MIDGEQLDLELQIKCQFEPPADAPDSVKRTVGMLTILFEEGDENEFLSHIVSSTPSVDWSGLEHLPIAVKFYTYNGSETTPGCEEIYTWFILADFEEASAAQLKFFTDKWAGDPNFAGGRGNNRITQPINNRVVFLNGEDYDDYS
jgi:carbonic anhydrase